MITDSLRQAVEGPHVVAVTVLTSALVHYAADLASSTDSTQLWWLNPRNSGGTLGLAAEFGRLDARERRICQLSTASHINPDSAPGELRLFLLGRADVAALPARHLDDCHQTLDQLLPGQFGHAKTVV
jgi:hypothetical protein